MHESLILKTPKKRTKKIKKLFMNPLLSILCIFDEVFLLSFSFLSLQIEVKPKLSRHDKVKVKN